MGIKYLVHFLNIVPDAGWGSKMALNITFHHSQHTLVEGTPRQGVHHLEQGVPDIQDNVHYILCSALVLVSYLALNIF